MKGTDIINVAREKLKSFIVFEVRNIYLLLNGQEPNFEEDEEYVLDVEGLTIKVEVDNSYLDVEETIMENRTITEIHLSLDGNLFLVPYGDDDTEIEWTDLSTDEVAALANVLENQYLNIVKSNTL